MKTKKILILEDEMLQALDLSEFLTTEGYITQIEDSFEKGLKAVRLFQPHLILCDINLKASKTGIDFAKEVNALFSGVELIFITAITKAEIILAAQDTDPLNYIVKPWKEDQIKVTIQIAFNYIEGKLEKNEIIEKLTMAEYKVVKLIAKQKSSKEIADILYISDKTVKNHRHNIIQKLNLSNEKNSLLKWASNNADI